MLKLFLIIGLVICQFNILQATKSESPKLLIVTIATDETDGFKRFKHSLDYFGLESLVIGMGKKWMGGDLRIGFGGGFKINLLRKALAKYKDDKNLILFFTDSYDVVFMNGKDDIITKFKEFNAKIVFSAENTLWPDRSLKDKYPQVEVGKRYLCSGGIIGYADVFWDTIHQWDVKDIDDDQLYYTKVYINSTARTKLNATLDHTSKLVHNINFAKDEIQLLEEDGVSKVKNVKYSTYPSVLHGNGPSKIYLSYLGNYVPDGWHSEHGCKQCDHDLLDLKTFTEENLPRVQLAIFIEEPTPFVEEFLNKLLLLFYPKSRMTLFIHNTDDYTEKIVSKFLLHHRAEYAEVKIIAPHEFIDQTTARNMAVELCLSSKCDYQFSVDANVQITDPHLLKFLMSKNKQVVSPIVKRDGKLWSNFWGAINMDGFYARSDDYLAIVNEDKVGIWNVPFANGVYLTKVEALQWLKKKKLTPYTYDDLDPDMAYCNHLRDEGIFIYVTNEKTFGRLLLTNNVKTNQVHPDLWQIQDNPKDWEAKYLHPGFWNMTLADTVIPQPCPDAYIFPLLTHEGADAIVDVMETHGGWSNGRNKDERLAGGYENVPTVDIHMNQVGYEKQWLHLLATYPAKIVEKVYPGFYTKAHSIMMFVVRYKPSEQSFLRPHHDSSTWTMNVALNTHGDDYEGGGCRFLRYNCSVVQIPKGYAVVHPGRLTHYHEGLQTTKGTRYIAVSFVDP